MASCSFSRLSWLLLVAALVASSVSADQAAPEGRESDLDNALSSDSPPYTRNRHITAEETTRMCRMEEVELSTIGHVHDVFGHLTSAQCSHACSRRVETAIIELHDIVSESADNVCTQDKARKVADWFNLYGLFSPENMVMIPAGLKRFFYAYGLRLSEACRKNMAAHLVADAHERLSDEDYAVFNKWTNEESFLSRIIKDPKDFDDLLLPKKLNKVLKKGSDDERRIYIETPTAGEIKKIQQLCEKRFKPFYESLITPLITLSEAHFNHKGESIERDLTVGKEVYQWYRVTYMCESLADIEIIENPDGATVTDEDGQKAKRVKLLTREQADELKRLVPQTEEPLERIEYEPAHVSLTDGILDYNDIELRKTLDSFKFKFPINDIYDLMEPKPLRKLFKFIKNNLRKAPIFIASKLSGMRGTTNEKKFGDQMLVKFIDDYVRQLESGQKPKGGLFHEVKWLWELNKVKIITGLLMVCYIIMSTTLLHAFGK